MSSLRRRADWRFAAIVFFACLGVASIVSGAASALRTGYALATFGGESFIPGFLLIETLRVRAAHIAAMSTCVAWIAWIHRSGPGAPLGRWRIHAWLPFAFVPVAAVLATFGALLAGGGVAAAMYGMTRATFAAGVARMATPADAIHGLAKASIYGLILGALAVTVAPMLGRAKLRLRWTLIFAWFMTGLFLAILDVGLDPILTDPSAADDLVRSVEGP